MFAMTVFNAEVFVSEARAMTLPFWILPRQFVLIMGAIGLLTLIPVMMIDDDYSSFAVTLWQVRYPTIWHAPCGMHG